MEKLRGVRGRDLGTRLQHGERERGAGGGLRASPYYITQLF